MRTIMNILLDLSNPHDKLAYNALESMGKEERHGFIIAAVLYYLKSPSYLALLKMEEYLSEIKELSSFFSGSELAPLVQKLSDLSDMKEDLVKEISSAVLSKLDGLELSKPSAKSRKGKQASEEMPDEAIEAMAHAFST